MGILMRLRSLWGRLWFYEEVQPLKLGFSIQYRLRYFLIVVWTLSIFGVIALAFVAHLIHWEAGATTLLGLATVIAGGSCYKLLDDTRTVKRLHRSQE